MRVVQATWDISGKLVIWAEDSELYDNRDARNNEANYHPFAASHDTLNKDIESLEFEADSETEIQLLLPSENAEPFACSMINSQEDGEERKRYDLKPWIVPALVLEPTPAIAFLTSIPNDLPNELRIDTSLKYWIECTKLVLELLSRGSFLPSVYSADGNYKSKWLIIPDERMDGHRIEMLESALPPVCRSIVSSANNTSTPRSSEVFWNFVETSADNLIRSFLSRYEDLDQALLELDEHKQKVSIDWLKSLTSQNPAFSYGGFELAKLEASIQRWTKHSTPIGTIHLKTLFKLSSPELPDDQLQNISPLEKLWELEFFIQDPSSDEVLPASSLWQGNIGFLQNSDLSNADVENRLLKDLALAARIYDPIDQVLNELTPSKGLLSTQEAYTFLKDVAPILEKSEFNVVLPAWWHKPETTIGLRLKVESNNDFYEAEGAIPQLASDKLFDFSWEIAVGSNQLSTEEFDKLVNQQIPLVNVKGQWVEFNQSDIKSTLAFLQRQNENPKTALLDVIRQGLGIGEAEFPLPILGIDASGWIKRFLEADTSTLPNAKQPEMFEGSLRPYQLQGLAWMSFIGSLGCGACLADDMGLGKTIQFLALLQSEREQALSINPNAKLLPTLLIVPMSILDNWERECRKFTPNLKFHIHHGNTRLGHDEFIKLCSDLDLVVTTYSLAYRDSETVRSIAWGRIALDEAQNIKNLNTKQTKAIRQLAYEQLASKIPNHRCQRLALTGTPLENHLDELWSIFDFLNPGYLGSIKDFRAQFSVPIEKYRNNDTAQKLSAAVTPFLLRRLKTDKSIIEDLPEKLEMDVFTSLTEEQGALYKSVVDRMMDEVSKTEGIKRKGLILATITKLKQICNHPALYLKDGSTLDNRSGKLKRLEELLEVIISEKDKVLIFTQYAHMGGLLKSHLQRRFAQDVLFMHGGLTRNARQKLIDKFHEPNGPSIFVLSLKVGGLGLNLTPANQIIHYDQWWNPAVQQQATDRAYRIGQRKNVQVRTFICKGTLEEQITNMLHRKKDLADKVVSATRNEITDLPLEELRKLLDLKVAPESAETYDD